MTRPNVLFGYSIGVSANGDTLAVAEYDADRGQGRALRAHAQRRDLVASGPHPGRQRGERRLARLLDGHQRRWEHDRRGRGGRRLPDPGDQSGGLRQGPAAWTLGRGRVRVRAKRDHVDAAGVPQVVEPGASRTGSASASRSAATATPSPSRRRTKTARRRASTASRTTTPPPEAGAVYYFTRTGTTWVQQAYVKASNTRAGDEFGVLARAERRRPDAARRRARRGQRRQGHQRQPGRQLDARRGRGVPLRPITDCVQRSE